MSRYLDALNGGVNSLAALTRLEWHRPSQQSAGEIPYQLKDPPLPNILTAAGAVLARRCHRIAWARV
jgi:hypothetical protein